MRICLCIFTIFSVLVLVKCDDQMFEECRKETGMTEEKLKMLSSSKEALCLSACMMKKKGVIVNGEAVMDKVIEDISKDMPESTIDAIKIFTPACVNKANKKKDECMVFMVLRDCLIKKRLISK